MNRSMFLLQFLLPMALFMAAQGADAATIDPAELQVGGVVRVPSCSIVASAGGNYDFGLRSQAVLPVTGHLALQPQTQTWTVDCGAARTFLMYSITDNRESSSSVVDQAHFGLGSVPGRDRSRIGYYVLNMSNARVDGSPKTVLLLQSGLGTLPFANPNYFKWRPGYSWHTSTASGGPWNAASPSQAGSRFEVDIRVSPYLASRDVVGGGQPITDAVKLDGSATITFSFGL